ncbi:PRP39 [Candida theae]|uniref:PRP39 n=1 Tax=Candida theae TaxID=1198502 RepID=A0AAD5BFR6_9ASCO|nr:PRP39 [Candida theae]KAI5959541.1 PRP39 [Candida theae]
MATLPQLPSDLEPIAESSTSTSINDYADELEQKLEKDPNDIGTWNLLFNAIDEIIDVNVSQADTSKGTLSDEVKRKIHNTYKALVTRFPYLEEVWKRWSVVEYKLNGLDASIDVLRMAVESFPHSVSLWTDYLTALKSTPNTASGQFRLTYKEALKYNGYHFMSHPIWDKAIEFETEKDPRSKELLSLYLTVVQVPLYQYAQYYSQFSEINKNFDIQELMDKDKLADYVEKFGKSRVEDLSLIEKHQIIDDYFATIFASTQAKVSSNWEYEQVLLSQEFSPDKKRIEEERHPWVEYIDGEIPAYKATNNDKHQFNFICNLFERALIPNCFDEELWLMYIRFIEDSNVSEETKGELEREIYVRVNSKFIPLNNCRLRKLYAYHLLRRNEVDAAIEYLFDWMKAFSGTTQQYIKSPYLEMTREILRLWDMLLSEQKFQKALEFLLNCYFDKPNEEKRMKLDATEDLDNQGSYQLQHAFLNSFAEYLNEDSIAIVVDHCFDIYKREADSLSIRTLFNKHYKDPSLAKSPSFWRFMFEYEGIIEKNLTNLKRIHYLIKAESQLAKSVVDVFVDWYYDIAAANIQEFLVMNQGRSDESMIYKDLELSNSLFYNKSTTKRLARSNYKVLDNSNYVADPEQGYLDLCAKQAGHPGVFIDANPEMTNSFMNKGKYIDLTTKVTPVPPLPTFKGVEKVQFLSKKKSHPTRRKKN